MPNERLLIKVTRETLPKIRDRYPFVYLEHGRLEVDDSSVKWIDSDNRVIPLPIATIQMLLFGPGTSVTHEAIKVLSSVNCMAAWVGADSLLFYSFGLTPTADSRNLRKQVELSASPEKGCRWPKGCLQEGSLMLIPRMPRSRISWAWKAKG